MSACLIRFSIFALSAVIVLPVKAGFPEVQNGVIYDANVNSETVTQPIYFEYAGDLQIDYSTFSGITNTASSGNEAFGTIFFSSGNTTTTIIDSQFYNNSNANYVGGVLSTYGSAVLNISNSSFSNNHAYYDGGAIGNYGGLNITNSVFSGNTADYSGSNYDQLVEDSTAIGGGAISLGAISSTSIGSISNTLFTGNKSGTYGGAIGTRFGRDANNSAAKLDIDAMFQGNYAELGGGAIYNTFYANNNLGKGNGVTIRGRFRQNSTNANGGAIYNDGSVDLSGANGGIMTINNSTFSGNSATGNGGAIYNSVNAQITMNGTNVFSNNTAAAGADIYNAGTITIASGKTTIGSGMDGSGSLNIASGASLSLGNASINQSTITLNGTLTATLTEGSDNPAITASTFNGSGTLSLVLTSTGQYNVFGNAVFSNVDFGSVIYNIAWGSDNKTLTATAKTVSEIASENNISTSTAQSVINMSQSTSSALNRLSVRAQAELASGNTSVVEHANQAINPETSSVTQSVSSSVQNTVTSLVSNRMASVTSGVGRSGGDNSLTGGGIWGQGLINRSKLNDSFTGDTSAIAAGIDVEIVRNMTIGLGYSYSISDVNASARDTDIDSHTVFVYGQYKPSQWYANGMLNYTISNYNETGQALGVAVTSDYDIDSFGGQIAMGYDFASGLTPEIAVRYLHVGGVNYANSLGINNSISETDYLTGVLGGRYAFDYLPTKTIRIRPEIQAAVKYDLISDESVSTVTMPGVNSYIMPGHRLNRLGGEFGLGLRLLYNGADISLNYYIDFREDYTSQTGMIKLRYNF